MKTGFPQILRVIAAIAMIASVPALAGDLSVPRNVLLDDGWKFIKGDVGAGSESGFDDSAWQAVTIPHTWNNMDGEDGGNNYYRGPGWYRRHLQLRDGDEGKSIFLKFDGAAIVTDVFVNGKKAGTHKGAFGAFCFDITPLIQGGGDNVIAVRVTNAKDPDVAPLSGDFTIFGGIYRDVHLLRLNKLSISPLDYASPGVYLKQHDVGEDAASVDIATVLRNDGGEPKVATLRYAILDAHGRTVLTATSAERVAASGTATAERDVTIARPHLWAGRRDPYLYRVRVEVLDGKNVVDSVEQPLGLRSAKVDPDRGLFLNGRHYALHGVDRHQDRKDKGWAIGPAEHLEDFNLIMEMGCTGVRLAHYQHTEYFYELCDKGGLVVWAELPLVNDLGGAAFNENARQQLNELVKQNYNHPSIIFWSLSNELHNKKKWSQEPVDWSLIKDLNTYVHALDPSRITTLAACIKDTEPINGATDVVAFNRYPGWYTGKPEDWPGTLDKLRQDLPGRAIGISEYGAGANAAQHEENPQQPKAGGNWHPEEWQSHVHEIAWKAMEERPWLWCTFLWNMFDFASDGRKEGNTPGINDKGMVTYDRKIRKDAFYWYKANWSSDPFVHINSGRFTPRPTGPATVRVYSNLGTVELSVNGRSEGSKLSKDHIFEWNGVMLTSGANTVTATAWTPRKEVNDTCVWEGSADAPEKLGEPAVEAASLSGS